MQPEPENLLEGRFEVDVVGESFYKESFEALPSGDCYAELRPDPANPYDEHCIGVFIDGHQVGNLSRDNAEKLCGPVTARTQRDGPCIVRAEVRGRGRYGSVKLTLPMPEDF